MHPPEEPPEVVAAEVAALAEAEEPLPLPPLVLLLAEAEEEALAEVAPVLRTAPMVVVGREDPASKLCIGRTAPAWLRGWGEGEQGVERVSDPSADGVKQLWEGICFSPSRFPHPHSSQPSPPRPSPALLLP